ncbi:hypothetical protein [Rhodobium gokarnense]|uniref:Uncharacterized protein n=1 Tax=Rhodobium gokarnense TaxID=364296 RepID=A0ABT3HCE6_9HYPH|nr:hypothetical protein [Rhodobium gokarnense]MCW2308082.1 hypothetical protein [Rhodobium gokarnense]
MRAPILSATIAGLFGLFLVASAVAETSFPRAELDDEHERVEVSAGGITARVIAEPQISGGATEVVPLLEVIVDGRTVLRTEGVSAGSDWRQGAAEIAEMDPGNATPEVVFSSYSGGAHCCTRVIVAAADKAGKWSAHVIGDWDGGGDYLEDADGDGTGELVIIDNRFLYAFDCYACSAAPLKILAIRNGKPVDVTRDKRFEKKHRTWIKAMEGWAADRNGEFAAGFYAGWVAQKSLVGEGKEAWEAMLEAYKKAPQDEGYDICRTGQPMESCKPEDQVSVPFPEALKAFLDEAGYRF